MSTPPPPVLYGRYRILRRLGQSRLAAVYRAQDERLQRAVLVHLLRPELMEQAALVKRFLEEAQRGAQRSHQGLLEVFDSGDVEGRPYLVTEDIAGQPLAECLPLPMAEALGVLRTVAGAVALAQSQGSPHPPISSHNVWLLANHRAVLLENWLLTPHDAALDLAHYRAPERARGTPPSPTTTVYALGILSWETVAGRRPFTGPTPDAIVAQQVSVALPSLSDVRPQLFAPGLDRVIAGAADADPDRRYPSPVDFGRALDLFVDQATAHTGRLAILPQPQPIRASQTGVFRRRGDTAPGTTVQPPPPPAVIHTAPQIASRAAPPPRPTPAADQPITGKQLQRAVSRAMRRRGCQQALVKRSLQAVLIIVFIYLALIGIDAATSYASGRVRQFDPSSWITQHLPTFPSLSWPDFSWFQRARGIVGGSGGSTTLVVTQPVNLRPGPTTSDASLRSLAPGTVLRQIEGPVEGTDGLGFRWIKVVVVEDGTTGWVADQPDRLSEQ